MSLSLTPSPEKIGWVQTERATHEMWAKLTMSNPRAAGLLHLLVSEMREQTAVVMSRATLAELMGCSEATVKRAVADLRAGSWIETVQLGGKGGVNAYVLNSRVAWVEKRKKIHLAHFTATVIANKREQAPGPRLPRDALVQLPVMLSGESQLPTGPGEGPPGQPTFDGLEVALPATTAPEAAR